MREKYVALLLVCHVVAACVKAETMEEKRKNCYNYCKEACIYPKSFCKWWCHGRCKNPALCGNLISIMPYYSNNKNIIIPDFWNLTHKVSSSFYGFMTTQRSRG